MQGKEIFENERPVVLTEQQILEEGKVYEAGFQTEFFTNLSGYGTRRLNQLYRELIYGDQDTLHKVYFLKGQIVGILDIMGEPEKAIGKRNRIIEDRDERAKKKKEKEKKSAGR